MIQRLTDIEKGVTESILTRPRIPTLTSMVEVITITQSLISITRGVDPNIPTQVHLKILLLMGIVVVIAINIDIDIDDTTTAQIHDDNFTVMI